MCYTCLITKRKEFAESHPNRCRTCDKPIKEGFDYCYEHKRSYEPDGYAYRNGSSERTHFMSYYFGK